MLPSYDCVVRQGADGVLSVGDTSCRALAMGPTRSVGTRLLQQHPTQEVAVAACQECFFLTAIVFILAMVPALFIRPQRRQVWRKGA
jgi:hypothetical protein